MTAEWRAIAKTPHYEVNDVGEIRNAKYDRILTPSKNQFGHLKVNLPTPEGKIRTRQVNHIVAEAFIPEPNRDDFISIIHLNGDKTNCAAVNMQWRPRYFAIRYHLQFQTDLWREVVFGIILGLADWAGAKRRTLDQITVPHGILFGFAQALALIPGVSRSGGTITMGLFLGYERAAAARYAFLLAIPAVFGSGFYQLFKSWGEPAVYGPIETAAATLVAFVVAILVIAFFMQWISRHSFLPFVIYRILLGGTIFALLATGTIDA
jgi:hypothetical protein